MNLGIPQGALVFEVFLLTMVNYLPKLISNYHNDVMNFAISDDVSLSTEVTKDITDEDL